MLGVQDDDAGPSGSGEGALCGEGIALRATLWVPGPLPGLNELIAAAKGSGGRGAGYARLKRQWTDVVQAIAQSKKVPRFEGRAFFIFTWIERDRRRDPDNVAAGGRKLILDGLVRAGVISGDGWAAVGGWNDVFMAPAPGFRPGEPGVIVSIATYTPEAP